MTIRRYLAVTLTVASLAALLARASNAQAPSDEALRYWGQWRGPSATGVSTTANPPVAWSETNNIQWKVPIPGSGHGSPVVWNDRIYITTAIPADGNPQARAGVVHRFVVMALDRQTGDVVWEHLAREEAPHEPGHAEHASFASGSALTDGTQVIAFFESRGIYAFDMDGTLLWDKDLGDKHMRNQFGEGTTPVLSGDTLVVVWDHLGGQSFIVALDKRTGNELWRRNRDDTMDTWATPLVVEANGRRQVIVGAMEHVRSYDLETGELVWHTSGLTMNVIPSPVATDGLAILMSGFRGNMLKAVRVADAQGDITDTNAIAWTMERDTPYVPSPLLYDDTLYMLKSNNGLLSVLDVHTGEHRYPLQRLTDVPNVFASPVGAAGRIYVTGRDGATVVLRHGASFEVLAVNSLDDQFDASPALVDDELIMRGHHFLYSIAEP